MATNFIFMPIALYAPSLALSAVTPISMRASVLALGLLCTAYSSIVSHEGSIVIGWSYMCLACME